MRRREFIALLGVAAATRPLFATAQDAGRTYRLGLLWPLPPRGPSDPTHKIALALFDELRRLGFIERQNLTIDYRAYAAHVDLTSQYALELVKAEVDVILAAGDIAIRAAQQATKTIPILAFTDDLVGSGLVDSMARPSGNTTGISVFAPELNGKRQELLIEAVPGLRQMAALADTNTTSDVQLRELQESARSRNVELSIQRVTKGEEVMAAIDSAIASGATALNVLGSPLLWANRYLIMDRVAALHLPAMYQSPEIAEEGGFAGYGPRAAQLFRDIQARQLVQILRGTKVADIPVEQPTKFELVINLKTANALGVTVPTALLVRADEVIE
jgi:putative tryptophan/tyrosine transport system substrate-binding protein